MITEDELAWIIAIMSGTTPALVKEVWRKKAAPPPNRHNVAENRERCDISATHPVQRR